MSSQLKPTISIIAAIYNEAEYIEELINSVRAQSFSDWELVLVDDGSTDNTVEIVKAAERLDSRVRIVAGLGKLRKVPAFNRAFQESVGDYVMLIGGDDTLPPDSLETRFSALKHDPSDLACAYFRLKTMSDDPKYCGIVVPKRNTGNRSAGTQLMTRALANKVFPIPEELVAEDIYLSEMVRIYADNVIISDAVVLNYRIHAGNSNPRNKSFGDMTHAMHARMEPYRIILRQEKNLSEPHSEFLRHRIHLESKRYSQDLIGVLCSQGVTVAERLRAASMTNSSLWALRTKFYRLFSGWS